MKLREMQFGIESYLERVIFDIMSRMEVELPNYYGREPIFVIFSV